MAIVSIFLVMLIMVALIGGMAGCGQRESIRMVATGELHVVGLESNGRVVAVGDNYYGQCNVEDWIDITQIAAGSYHTLGLEQDGRVVATGDDEYCQCSCARTWTDI